jgi:spore germination cell wall hydrolase CwlJ-like protein
VPEVVIQTIAMESASEPDLGMVWVAKVIQTRAERANISPDRVVMRPKQFSCWNDRKWAYNWLKRYYGPSTRQRAIEAWNKALIANLGHPTHYHTVDVMPYWAKGHKPMVRVGRHVFYNTVK